MYRRATFLFVIASLFLALPAPAAAQDENPLEGAWLVESVDPADEEVVENPQPALFLFTDNHYSITVVLGEEPRDELPELEEGEEPTDARKLKAFEAYEEFISNAGRYEVQGDSLTYRAYVAKNPSYMHAFPDNANTVGYRMEGDMLHVNFGEVVVTLRQVDGEPMSY